MEGSLPGSGRSLGEELGNPLQYSCLKNPTDRGAQQAAVHSAAKSWTRLKQLSTSSDGWWGLLDDAARTAIQVSPPSRTPA